VWDWRKRGYMTGVSRSLRRPRAPRAASPHPVVFVHGNQADAQNWLDVMLQFENDAGYSMQEMYALSYNGLGNYGSGAPVTVLPTQADEDYIAQNPNVLANGGHGAGDDDNVVDLSRFVEAVQAYTGSQQVDIVAHSLGVTIVRRLMALYPGLARNVVAFVGIAGANHGTTVCRGLEATYYGCNEIAPGTPPSRAPTTTTFASPPPRSTPISLS
jgi:triacylglycerol esterase/lipase EstA (alpha/beta hydrolase family)